MSPELDKALVDKYPEIFRDRTGSPTETLMCFGFECGDGWYGLLDALCYNIQQHINWKNRKEVVVEQVVAEQVKEKFGGLRFYYRGGDDYIRGLTSMAESMSYQICDVCGNRGERRGGGWIRTLCDRHEEERN